MTGLPFASLWCLNSIEWCIITCAPYVEFVLTRLDDKVMGVIDP